jgi:hypothetical protein
MAVYTVQAPTGSTTEPFSHEPDLERAVFLREGFSWGAFVFGVFWLLWNRLWLAALIWVIVIATLGWLAFTYLAVASIVLITLTVHLWLGLEGREIIRQTLAQRHYRLVGVVTATSLELAERLFFSRAVDFPPVAPSAQVPPPPSSGRPHGDVLGLFPEPELRR